MNGVDLNILVRAFTGDDPAQAAAAAKLIDGAPAEALFVNVIVLVEFAWTLRRAYRWDDDRVRLALNQIVSHPALLVQHRDCVLELISKTDRSAGGMADRLIGALNRGAGCATTWTFDKAAARDRDFRELSA